MSNVYVPELLPEPRVATSTSSVLIPDVVFRFPARRVTIRCKHRLEGGRDTGRLHCMGYGRHQQARTHCAGGTCVADACHVHVMRCSNF